VYWPNSGCTLFGPISGDTNAEEEKKKKKKKSVMLSRDCFDGITVYGLWTTRVGLQPFPFLNSFKR
jgi:hypothetical protein